MKSLMKMKTNNQLRQETLAGTSILTALAGNLKTLKSHQTINSIRHEMLSSGDQHPNDVVDVTLRAQLGDFGALAKFTVLTKVSAFLIKDDWLETAANHLRKTNHSRMLLVLLET